MVGEGQGSAQGSGSGAATLTRDSEATWGESTGPVSRPLLSSALACVVMTAKMIMTLRSTPALAKPILSSQDGKLYLDDICGLPPVCLRVLFVARGVFPLSTTELVFKSIRVPGRAYVGHSAYFQACLVAKVFARPSMCSTSRLPGPRLYSTITVR